MNRVLHKGDIQLHAPSQKKPDALIRSQKKLDPNSKNAQGKHTVTTGAIAGRRNNKPAKKIEHTKN